MKDSKTVGAAKKAARIDKSRAQFRALITSNPNYFGNLSGTKFKVVKKIIASTSFEKLTELGYNPHLKQLSATFDLKKTSGYGGDLCTDGTQEFVRFYVDLGSGWEDAGLVGTDVTTFHPARTAPIRVVIHCRIPSKPAIRRDANGVLHHNSRGLGPSCPGMPSLRPASRTGNRFMATSWSATSRSIKASISDCSRMS